MKKWNEEEHPRDDDGKFTASGSSARSGTIVPDRGVPYKPNRPQKINMSKK